MLNIVYSSSDSYSWLTGVSLTSLFENNTNVDFMIFILSNNISDNNIGILSDICNKYGAKYKIINISSLKEKFANIKIHERWDFATFGRLFEASLIDESVEKILHIDCDTIVNGSIAELFDINMDGKAVAGVKDCLSKNYLKCIGTDKENYIFNAGVLLFNLDYIRKNNIMERFTKKIFESKRLMYLDQDVLNVCLSKEEKHVLPLAFNFYSLAAYCTYNEMITIRTPDKYYSKEEYELARTNPTIIHFTSCSLDHGRPWCVNNNHPYKKLFEKYHEISLFSNVDLIENQKSKKIQIINSLPKCISYRIARLINAVLKPLLLKNR